MGLRLRAVVVVAGVAASLGLTYLALRDIDFGAFSDALASGEPAWLGAALAAFAAAYAVRVLRWRLLFAGEHRPPFGALTRALVAGEFFTSLLPLLRLGEVARVVVLNRAARTPRSEALGTVVAERIHDTVALLVLLFVAAVFAPSTSWLGHAAVLLAVVGVVLLIGLAVLARFGSSPLALILRPLARAPGFSRARTELAAEGIVRGLTALRNPRAAAAAFALSLVFWVGIAASYTLALRVVEVDLALDAGILVAVATTFSLLLPALPASVGIFEAAAVVALRPYDVDGTEALSGAVVIHALSFVPFLVVGPPASRGRVFRPR